MSSRILRALSRRRARRSLTTRRCGPVSRRSPLTRREFPECFAIMMAILSYRDIKEAQADQLRRDPLRQQIVRVARLPEMATDAELDAAACRFRAVNNHGDQFAGFGGRRMALPWREIVRYSLLRSIQIADLATRTVLALHRLPREQAPPAGDRDACSQRVAETRWKFCLNCSENWGSRNLCRAFDVDVVTRTRRS